MAWCWGELLGLGIVEDEWGWMFKVQEFRNRQIIAIKIGGAMVTDGKWTVNEGLGNLPKMHRFGRGH